MVRNQRSGDRSATGRLAFCRGYQRLAHVGLGVLPAVRRIDCLGIFVAAFCLLIFVPYIEHLLLIAITTVNFVTRRAQRNLCRSSRTAEFRRLSSFIDTTVHWSLSSYEGGEQAAREYGHVFLFRTYSYIL